MTETQISDSTSSPATPSSWFNPYVLWRRGMLPLDALAPLVPEETWALLEQSKKGEAARQDLAVRLSDSLFHLAPRLSKDERRHLLQLRRDLHNDRFPNEQATATVERLVGAEDRAALEQWRRSHLNDQETLAAAGERLASQLREARARLALIISGEYFLRGIQLSGKKLYEDVRSYLEHIRQPELRPLPKRLRQTENTIIRYAYRMALRTSPFGCFTEIGAQPWRATNGPAPLPATGRRHLARLSRGLLAWMVYELRRIEGCDSLLRLRLNNTLQLVDGSLEAFTRGADGGEHAYWGEGFVNVKLIGAFAVVLKALADGPLPKGQVLQLLGERGMPADRALSFVERLIEAGVCHQDLALPDQTTSFPGEVAARLRGVPTPQAAACAEVFETLEQLERGFGAAAADERERLLDELARQVRHFADICGVAAPPAVTRSFVFEDVAAQTPARSWDPELLEQNAGQFSRLMRLLPVFDEATFERLGLYTWFLSRFGEKGRCDDLLALYRSFNEQSQSEISAVMRAEGNPDAERARAWQRALLRSLDDAVAAAVDASTLRLSEGCLDELSASIPDSLPPWSEAAFRLQFVPAGVEGSPLVVINNVASGYGMSLSRFCDVVEPGKPGAWSLRRAVRETIARNNPDQTDLTAVLGLNVNLHPPLTPREIVYPGSVATNSADALTLRDIAVEADPASHTLRLVSRLDGRPILLTPMNFLFPAAAPMLYRFLCAFAPLHNYHVSLGERLRRLSGRDYLPRLVLGDLVLERRRWYVPTAALAELGDGSAVETVASLLVTQRWYRGRGLPRESFFHVRERAEGVGDARDWMDETRRWAINARSARRKGQYVDFHNPFLVRLLVKQAQTVSDGVVVFQECLPPPAAYAGHDGPDSAEEFLVELRARRAGRGDGVQRELA